jgi:LysR family transcriptional regulator (chromosome initiation inhibitor)
MILLNQNIEAFLVVAELQSVSAAARRLGLTQTGVTQRIKALEREVKIALFTRSRSGMRLTPEGQSFLRYCLDARGLEERLITELRKSGTENETNLTLVGPANLIGGRVSYQCRHVFDKWPKLNFRFSIDSYANRLNRLKQGTVDLAILQAHEVSAELDSKLLKPLEYILVCTSAWKGRSLEDILQNERLYAWNAEDAAGLEYLKTFNLLQHLRRPRLYANEDQVLQNQLALGVGFGILPRELAAPLLEAGKLHVLNGNKSVKVKMALAWYPRSDMPDYFREIVRSIS